MGHGSRLPAHHNSVRAGRRLSADRGHPPGGPFAVRGSPPGSPRDHQAGLHRKSAPSSAPAGPRGSAMALSSRNPTRRGRSTRWVPAPPGPPAFAPSPVYRPRRPTETPLYPVVQHHLETFLAEAEQPDGRSIPSWVEHDFRRYLTCGILAHGFARLRCDACAQERLLAFSCKGRGVCPSCTTRRIGRFGKPPLPLPPMPPSQQISYRYRIPLRGRD